MAFTPTEEALVRALLDKQAAILSLAGKEATITSKLGATKVTLSDLVAASSVGDTNLILTRQGATDKSLTPLLLKTYVQSGMATQAGVQAGSYNTAVASGTANAIAADFTPDIALTGGTTVSVRAGSANTSTTPTFAPDGLTAKTIVKGNNLPLAVGDIAGAGHWLEMNFDTTLGKWVLQNPANGVIVASPKVLQVVEATPYTTYTGTAVVIPADDTVPQNTEGLEILSVTITPTSATSRLRIEHLGMYARSNSGTFVTAALFQDSTAGALAAASTRQFDSGETGQIVVQHEMVAGTTSPTTFKIRFGASATTAFVNGTSAARLFGGISAARLRVTEIAA